MIRHSWHPEFSGRYELLLLCPAFAVLYVARTAVHYYKLYWQLRFYPTVSYIYGFRRLSLLHWWLKRRAVLHPALRILPAPAPCIFRSEFFWVRILTAPGHLPLNGHILFVPCHTRALPENQTAFFCWSFPQMRWQCLPARQAPYPTFLSRHSAGWHCETVRSAYEFRHPSSFWHLQISSSSATASSSFILGIIPRIHYPCHSHSSWNYKKTHSYNRYDTESGV